jgi:O-antigen/teichoic acid export membrane protein
VRGVLWTGSASFVQLLIPLVLYGFLPADQMGRFEAALTIVMLGALLGSLGLGEALVQNRAAGEAHFSSAFWTCLATGCAVTLLLIASASQIGYLLSWPNPDELPPLLIPLSLLIPLASVSGIFRARLSRELHFKPLAVAEIVSVLSYAVVVIALLPHYGLWSPIVGAVVREAALLVSLCVSARWCPRLVCSVASLREVMPFGLNFTGSRSVNFLNSHLATFFIMPLLGETAHGYYKFAHRMTLLPLMRLSTTITRVSFPTFSSIQDNADLLPRGYLKSVQSIALFMWPALVGLLVFTREILIVVEQINDLELGPALWGLRLLIVATLVKSVGIIVGSVFMAKGKANWAFYWALFSLLLLLPALYYATAYGIAGVAAAIAATALIFLLLSQHLVNRLTGLSFTDYASSLVRPLGVSIIVVAVLVAARTGLPADPLLRLASGAGIGVVTFLAATRLLAWDLCRQVWRSLSGDRSDATCKNDDPI